MTLYHRDGTRRVLARSFPLDYRDSVLHDLRAALTPPFKDKIVISPEIRAKERMKLFTAIADYKAHLGTQDHKEQRDEFIKAFLSAKLPNWGDGRVSFKGL